MGNFTSNHLLGTAEPQARTRPCTPLPPPRVRVLALDPRSPTIEIQRTPIQVESTPTAKNREVTGCIDAGSTPKGVVTDVEPVAQPKGKVIQQLLLEADADSDDEFVDAIKDEDSVPVSTEPKEEIEETRTIVSTLQDHDYYRAEKLVPVTVTVTAPCTQNKENLNLVDFKKSIPLSPGKKMSASNSPLKGRSPLSVISANTESLPRQLLRTKHIRELQKEDMFLNARGRDARNISKNSSMIQHPGIEWDQDSTMLI